MNDDKKQKKQYIVINRPAIFLIIFYYQLYISRTESILQLHISTDLQY